MDVLAVPGVKHRLSRVQIMEVEEMKRRNIPLFKAKKPGQSELLPKLRTLFTRLATQPQAIAILDPMVSVGIDRQHDIAGLIWGK